MLDGKFHRNYPMITKSYIWTCMCIHTQTAQNDFLNIRGCTTFLIIFFIPIKTKFTSNSDFDPIKHRNKKRKRSTHLTLDINAVVPVFDMQ